MIPEGAVRAEISAILTGTHRSSFSDITHSREARGEEEMTMYVNSTYAMKTGQGRHRGRRMPSFDTVIRALAVVAAFTVSAVALSGGMVLLSQAGVSLLAVAPAVALVFASGASFVLMSLLAGSRAERG